MPTLDWPGKIGALRRKERPLPPPPPLLLEEIHGARAPRSRGCDNLLIRGDNRLVLASAGGGPLGEALASAGGIRLIYMDPPFAVGTDFCMPVAEGAGGEAVRAVAYSDVWSGLPAFLSMLHERLLLAREALAPDGVLYLHCDYRTAAHLRLLLDEVFGPERFLGDIVWHYTGGGRARRWFSRKHDRILCYAASSRWYFNPDAVRVPYKPGSGYAKSGITSAAGKRYMPHPDGTPVDDVWDIPMVNPMAGERNGYPTQKPERLLERIILASSRPGDLVADFFCGSGTTAAVAARLGRRWLAVDDSPLAVHATRKRLLAQGGAFSLACIGPGRAGWEAPEKARFEHRAAVPGGELVYVLSDFRIRAEGTAGGVRVTLEGFQARFIGAAGGGGRGGRGRCGLAGLCGEEADAWTRWLDYWSVGWSVGWSVDWNAEQDADAPPACALVAPEGACAVQWHAQRQGKDAPALRTPPLAVPAGADGAKPARLLVTLVDVFANTCRLALIL